MSLESDDEKKKLVFHKDSIIEHNNDELNQLENLDLDILEDSISNQIQLIKYLRDEATIISIYEKPEVTYRIDKELLFF